MTKVTNSNFKNLNLFMKNIIIIFIFLFISISLNAQKSNSGFDYRFGIGNSFLGTGDMLGVMYENEINYSINNYLSSGISLGYGKSDYGASETASFLQYNLNVFFSPFKNNKRNDFRVGMGLSYLKISDAYMSSASWTNNQLIDTDYVFDLRISYGCNFIIENSYSITDKFLLGLKLYTQPYFNGDINSGILLKLGVRL